jgi:hypothetical protein
MSKCQHEFCSIKPNYNFINEKVGIFCNKHKENNMVNLKTVKQCCVDKCMEQARYNYITDKERKYCTVHRPKGTVPVPFVNPKDGICVEPDCNNPIYVLSKFQHCYFKQYPYCLKHRKFYHGMAEQAWRKALNVSCHKTEVDEDDDDDGYGSPYEGPLKWSDCL